MAEILVCAGRKSDPKHKGLWYDDDPVVVMPDGHEWGREELNPDKFRIVKMPGVDVNDLLPLLEPGPDDEGLRKAIKVDLNSRFIEKSSGKELLLEDVKVRKWRQ